MSDPGSKPEWPEIERVMGHALQLSEEQRAAYLEQQPPKIRTEVESLLAAYRRSSDFLGNETSVQAFAAVKPGAELGPYRIEAIIGQGGMGVVYRAFDTKLHRPVAVKFLFEDCADSAARRRFQREAQTASSLNHPHIVTVHDVGDYEGRQYLVTEFIDGGTLKEWVKAGKRSWRQIVELLVGVADGLAAAHAAGITHRDIKPDNVLITQSGYAKLADFGLAKLAERTTPADATRTISADATRPGMVVGTIAYMSPEQASGRAVDARSDVFSFGVMLYELLAGRRPFEGASNLELLQAIVHAMPQPLGADVPFQLRIIVEKALEKDPAERYQSTRDLVLDLRRLIRQSGEAAVARISPPLVAKREVSPRARLAWLVAALATVAAVVLAAVYFREKPAVAPTTRFQILPPDKAIFVDFPAISPDGRQLAFVATVEGSTRIWVRQLDSLDARPLPGTERPAFPFWSPDSRFLAFFSEGKLQKVDVAGGPVQILCNVASPFRGGSWGPNGTILFGAGTRQPLYRVSANGGAPAPMTALEPATELSHRWPHFLPDGRYFLYWLLAADPAKTAIVIASLDDKPDSRLRKRLLASNSMPVYSAGHLIFEREGALMAQPFDASRLRLRADPAPIVQQVGQNVSGNLGWAPFSASPDGVLAYRVGGIAKNQLAWFNRSGKELGRLDQPDELEAHLSPDQKRLVVARLGSQGNSDLWLLELARGAGTRFTFHGTHNRFPVWSPDGERIVFASSRGGLFDLYQKVATGAADEELLLKSGEGKDPTDWSSDGRYILYTALGPRTGNDIWVLPLEGDRKPFPVVQTEFSENLAQFSPDVHWIAYQSTDSGASQVYAQGFPKPGRRIQVSTSGGSRPRWSRDGKELYYVAPGRKLMVVEVRASAGAFEAGQPRELFQTTRLAAVDFAPGYDISADGQRFLMNTALETGGPPPMTVVTNWVPKN